VFATSTSRAPSFVPLVECLEARCAPSITQYVNALYNDFLLRSPTPSEAMVWASELRHGANPTQIALDFTTSPEYLNDLIEADYQTFLGRQPSAAEVAGWRAQLQAGLGENQLQAAFLASNEFFNDHGRNVTQWLTGVYQDVLGRVPDTAALAGQTRKLASGVSRSDIAFALVTSPEAFGRLVTAAYQDLLDRAPDPRGQTSWVTQLEHGLSPSEFLARIAGSAEFIADQGGLNLTPPGRVVVGPVASFSFTLFIGSPFIGATTAVFTGGFTGGGFTFGGFTGGGFTFGGFTGGGFTGGGFTGGIT
jgi:Domain of unknown function (DUF4214)